MKRMIILAALLFFAALVAGPALADDFYIYPNKGQSHDQMEKDKYNCYEWAKKQSGFDPMETPKATEPPPEQEAPRGGLLRGAARGAIIGGIAGDAGKGAAAGAVVGGMRRRSWARNEQYQQDQWAQKQAANYAQNRDSYNRAYSACLEGKGYTVK
jgi:hypothetical protein